MLMKYLSSTDALLKLLVSSYTNVSSIWTLSCSLVLNWVFNVSASSYSFLFQIKSNFLLACSSACSAKKLALVVL